MTSQRESDIGAHTTVNGTVEANANTFTSFGWPNRLSNKWLTIIMSRDPLFKSSTNQQTLEQRSIWASEWEENDNSLVRHLLSYIRTPKKSHMRTRMRTFVLFEGGKCEAIGKVKWISTHHSFDLHLYSSLRNYLFKVFFHLMNY